MAGREVQQVRGAREERGEYWQRVEARARGPKTSAGAWRRV